MKTRIAVCAAALLPAMISGCGSGSSNSSPSMSSNGTVAVSLTDTPACGYDHVYITVSQVSINSSTDGSGSWTDINLPTPEKIDLLSLTNGTLESLGQVALSAGTYQQLRLLLVANDSGSPTLNNSVVPSGQSTEMALKTPSAVQSGIKVNTKQPFTVQAGTMVDLVLDFNACASIVTTGQSHGNGATGYLLKPVITATPEVISGAIEGYVDSADAGSLVYAEQSGLIISGTVADSTGHFVLSPLEQSSGVGPYDVVITNSAKATDIIVSVPVTAGAPTFVSTADMPFTLIDSGTGEVGGIVNITAQATLAATQSIDSASYSIAATNADSTTGSYSFVLPVEAPEAAIYATPLPITLAPVSAAAGQYTITALSLAGNTATSPATVTADGTTTVDFPSLQ